MDKQFLEETFEKLNRIDEDYEFDKAWEEKFGTEGVRMSASDFMKRTLEMEKFINEYYRNSKSI